MLGIVRNYDRQRGFGFIESKEVERAVFVHSSQIIAAVGYLVAGDKVSFQMGEDHKGRPQAQRVRLAG